MLPLARIASLGRRAIPKLTSLHRAPNVGPPSVWLRLASTEAVKNETIDKIKELIEDKVRPVIQDDGGDIEFVSYENQILKVKLQGACVACPSSSLTLKNGVLNLMQFYVPEVKDVEQVQDEEDPED